MKFEKVKGGIRLVGKCEKMPCCLCPYVKLEECGTETSIAGTDSKIKSIVIKEIKGAKK
jgi:hypothetical protein